jgi:hypothetical protein
MNRLHDVPKRTTLTLDDDVAAGLARTVRSSGRPFRTVVNEAIRAGLSRPGVVEPFVVKAYPMGLREDLSLDSVSELLEQVEGPRHR